MIIESGTFNMKKKSFFTSWWQLYVQYEKNKNKSIFGSVFCFTFNMKKKNLFLLEYILLFSLL